MFRLRSLWVRLTLTALFASALLGSISTGQVRAEDDGGGEPINVPLILSDGRSLNWSGYAVSGPQAGAVTQVKGTWKVPSVNCGSVAGNAYSSAWVGIDGYQGATVQQIGTRHNCVNGVASYSAFYELFPQLPVTIDMRVRPEDWIRAAVSYTGLNTYELKLTNLRTEKRFSTTQLFVASRQSAEWIVERPMSGQLTALADFGSVEFKNGSVTVNGREGNPRDAKSLTMSNALGATLAEPSRIDADDDNDGFRVTWRRSQ